MNKKKHRSANKRPAKSVSSSFYGNALMLIAGLVVILALAMFGKDPFFHFIANAIEESAEADPTADLDNYRSVADTSHPSFVVLSDKLKSEGLEPVLEEFSVQRLSDSEYKYLWERGFERRKWEVYKDDVGEWMTNELP